MTAADLIALGAPALPEGHFYRVRPSGVLRDCFVVQIRREGRLVSWEVDEVLVDITAAEDAGREIADGCRYLFECQKKRLQAVRRWKAAERWVGDHR